jgi:hypothetical protein
MTTANLTVIGNVLFKRGNSTVASAYTGVPGEIIIDTTLQTIRVQDGTTVGGHVLASAQDAANIAGFAPILPLYSAMRPYRPHKFHLCRLTPRFRLASLTP